MTLTGHLFPPFPTFSHLFREKVQKAIELFPLGGIAPRGATLPGKGRLRNPETGKTMKSAASFSQQRETLTNPNESPQTDADGDHWPLTGYRCRVCRWPLHPIHARHGDDTHPTCDTAPPTGDLHTTPQRQPRTLAPGSPDDPGYCRQCGMTRPRHTSRCPTRKETR